MSDEVRVQRTTSQIIQLTLVQPGHTNRLQPTSRSAGTEQTTSRSPFSGATPLESADQPIGRYVDQHRNQASLVHMHPSFQSRWAGFKAILVSGH